MKKMMTSAKNLLGDEGSLSFRLPRAADGINYVKVTLTPADLYDMEFGRVTMGRHRGPTYKVKKVLDGLYNDQLKSVFESTTGLFTSLF